MAGRTPFQVSPPKYLYETYNLLRSSELILNKSLSPESIQEFQRYLNAAQPQSSDDSMMRSFVQFLYRKNPTNFCGFLIRSRLSHLILWTEAKCIVRHFGLRGVLYIKWSDTRYECSLHRNATGKPDNQFIALTRFENCAKSSHESHLNERLVHQAYKAALERPLRTSRRSGVPFQAGGPSRRTSYNRPEPDVPPVVEMKDSDYDEVNEADAQKDSDVEVEDGANKNEPAAEASGKASSKGDTDKPPSAPISDK